MIKQEKITEIRDRTSIVEVISDYVTLKKAGRNYQGLCPFHGENPSLRSVKEGISLLRLSSRRKRFHFL
jgi:DNA primase